MSSPISYVNSKGVDALYDPTASTHKIGVADVKILVDKGIFPFGKKANGQPFFNACGGKKRDNSQGKFAKGDICSKCKYVFGRSTQKAYHAKTCIDAQQGKPRTKVAKKAKVEEKVSTKLTARFERYASNFSKWALKEEGAKRPAFSKSMPKVKEVCDSPLGKRIITMTEVVRPFKGIEWAGIEGVFGMEEPVIVKLSVKEWFMKQYQLEGIELYPPKVVVEEESEAESDCDDDFGDEEEEEVAETASETEATGDEVEETASEEEEAEETASEAE